MKNLLVMHLEGINHSWFWQYQNELKALWALRDKSVYFCNYNTAGTSSVYSILGLLLGSVEATDCRDTVYDNGPFYNPKTTELFHLLHSTYGYRTLYGILSDILPSCSRSGTDNPCFKTELVITTGNLDARENPICQKLSQYGGAGQHFACFIHNAFDEYHLGPHVRDVQSLGMSLNPVESLRVRKLKLDRAAKMLFDHLAALGLMDNTVIVVYGDHGHADYNRQFTHNDRFRNFMVMAENSWTPMFLYDPALEPGVRPDQASSDDLRSTVLGRLFPNANAEKDESDSAALFPGVDLFKEKREFAYSQNKHALQMENPSYGESRKAYAILSDGLRLIAASVDRDSGEGGMELYIDQIDSGNCADLMEVFELDEEGRIVDFDVKPLRAGRLNLVHNLESLSWLAGRYEIMRNKLKEYVRLKEEDALKVPGANAAYRFPERSFAISAAKLRRIKRGEPLRDGKGIRWLAAKNKPLLLFGAGRNGGWLNAVSSYFGLEARGFLDNNPALAGTRIDGLPILPPREGIRAFPDALVVVCAFLPTVEKAMVEELRNLKVPDFCTLYGDIFGINGDSDAI